MSQAPIILNPNEEITLRRVAFGESPVRTLRVEDLTRLRSLRLIADGKDGPYLTASGRAHFETLPKPVMADRAGSRLAADIERMHRMKTGGA